MAILCKFQHGYPLFNANWMSMVVVSLGDSWASCFIISDKTVAWLMQTWRLHMRMSKSPMCRQISPACHISRSRIDLLPSHHLWTHRWDFQWLAVEWYCGRACEIWLQSVCKQQGYSRFNMANHAKTHYSTLFQPNWPLHLFGIHECTDVIFDWRL